MIRPSNERMVESMPDQTKTRGLQLALNSLDSALKVCEATKSYNAVMYINQAIAEVKAGIETNTQQPRPHVGEERREKE